MSREDDEESEGGGDGVVRLDGEGVNAEVDGEAGGSSAPSHFQLSNRNCPYGGLVFTPPYCVGVYPGSFVSVPEEQL